jgi:hypothetical protein
MEDHVRTTPRVYGRSLLALALIGLAGLATGCALYLPDQQDARLLGEGGWELTPSFSSVSVSFDGDSEHVQNQYGLHFGYGLSDRLDLRAGFARVSLDDDAGSTNIFGIGPKWGLVEDAMALYVPVGVVFGGDAEDTSDSWTVAPTVLVTLEPSPGVTLTPSVKGIYPFAVEDPELFLGFHLGAGIELLEGRLVLRPEGGYVIDPGEDGSVWGWTLGASIRP